MGFWFFFKNVLHDQGDWREGTQCELCFVPTFIHSFGAFYQRQVHNKCFTITTQALILF